jgi:hypothetical protein
MEREINQPICKIPSMKDFSSRNTIKTKIYFSMRVTISLILAMLLFSCSHTSTKVKKDQPNILFIMADDHATNAISAYGSHLTTVFETPNIDRLANEGIRMDRTYCVNAICTPSRAPAGSDPRSGRRRRDRPRDLGARAAAGITFRAPRRRRNPRPLGTGGRVPAAHVVARQRARIARRRAGLPTDRSGRLEAPPGPDAWIRRNQGRVTRVPGTPTACTRSSA